MPRLWRGGPGILDPGDTTYGMGGEVCIKWWKCKRSRRRIDAENHHRRAILSFLPPFFERSLFFAAAFFAGRSSRSERTPAPAVPSVPAPITPAPTGLPVTMSAGRMESGASIRLPVQESGPGRFGGHTCRGRSRSRGFQCSAGCRRCGDRRVPARNQWVLPAAKIGFSSHRIAWRCKREMPIHEVVMLDRSYDWGKQTTRRDKRCPFGRYLS